MVSPPSPGHGHGLGRVVMVVPTYNEALNLSQIVGRLRAAQPDVDVLVVDDNSPGRDRRPRRPDRGGRPPGLGPAPGDQGGSRSGVPARLPRRPGGRLRRRRGDGRRRVPPARGAAPAARRAGRRRPGDRLALGPRRQHRQLAAEPRAALARRQLLHPDAARHPGAGRDCRLPPVPAYDAGGDPPRGHRLARLRVPGGAGLPDRARGPAGRRGAHRVRRARARRLQDEPARRHRVAQADHHVGASASAPAGSARTFRRALGASRNGAPPPDVDQA